MDEVTVDEFSFVGDRWACGPFVEAGLRKEEVASIVHYWSSEDREEEVMAVFTTVDGRWGFFEAWCDYTGWDCQAGASDLVYASSEAELVPEMTADARRVFGYEATPDCGV